MPLEFPSTLLPTYSASMRPTGRELTDLGRHCWGVAVSCLLWPVPTEIPEKINATVGVTVKVTNRNFTEDLNNASSQAYWNFIQLFNSQVGVGKPRCSSVGLQWERGCSAHPDLLVRVAQLMDLFGLPKS